MLSTILPAGVSATIGIGGRLGGYAFATQLFDDVPPDTRRRRLVDTFVIGILAALTTAVASLVTKTAGTYAIGAFVGTIGAIAFIDARTTYIPDPLSLPLLGVGAAGPALTSGTFPIGVADAALGWTFAGTVFFVTAFLTETIFKRTAMSGGDIKFAAAIGAWTGPSGVMVAFLLGSVSHVVCGLLRKAMGRTTDAFPFGPALAIGGTVALAILTASKG